MTPDEYVARIKALVAVGRYRAVVELVRQYQLEMLPRMSWAQLVVVSDVMKGMDPAILAAVDAQRAHRDGSEGLSPASGPLEERASPQTPMREP